MRGRKRVEVPQEEVQAGPPRTAEDTPSDGGVRSAGRVLHFEDHIFKRIDEQTRQLEAQVAQLEARLHSLERGDLERSRELEDHGRQLAQLDNLRPLTRLRIRQPWADVPNGHVVKLLQYRVVPEEWA